jgi:hypothetical protein
MITGELNPTGTIRGVPIETDIKEFMFYYLSLLLYNDIIITR